MDCCLQFHLIQSFENQRITDAIIILLFVFDI